jgi:hypothetical protein
MHTASYDQNQDLADFDSDFGGDGFALKIIYYSSS